MLEITNKAILIALACFMNYIHLEGNSIDERSLMNVGYAMIGAILLDVALNLICLIVTGIISILHFIKKHWCKKSKHLYRLKPRERIQFESQTGKID